MMAFMPRTVIAAWIALAYAAVAARGQTLSDPYLATDLVAQGLNVAPESLVTAIVCIDAGTALLADRQDGRIHRLTLDGATMIGPGPVVLDLDVISSGYAEQSEYGIQAMELHPQFAANGQVYIRYDKSPVPGDDTPQADVVLGGNFSASVPTANVIERFVWDPAGNGGVGELIFDTLIHSVIVDTRYHHGGPIEFLPDGTMCAVYGDLRRVTGVGWLAQTAGALLSVNNPDGVIDDHGTIIRLNDDGSVPADNPFAGAISVNYTPRWLAYGIRNSFGMAADPANGTLWYTENGPSIFDEINRVSPGDNNGWKLILGPAEPGATDTLVMLPGAAYRDPAFSWLDTIGVTGMHFLYGSALGPAYDDLLLVGCVNDGHLWGFRLDAERECFVFESGALQDLVDDRVNALEDPPGPDGHEIVFGMGFGTGPSMGILAIERGADGLPYLLTAGGKLYRIRNWDVLDLLGSPNLRKLLVLLAGW